MKLAIALIILLCLTACQTQTPDEKPPEQNLSEKFRPEQAPKTPATADELKSTTSAAATNDEVEIDRQEPPRPPLFEDFQGQPQMSLFPRAGAYRPELEDSQGLQFWRTYIDHLLRTSGPVKVDQEGQENIVFGFRAIKGIDSVGFFSPIAVHPSTRYEVRASVSCDLAPGATAGIGLLEFDKFQWLGEQFPESLSKKTQIGSRIGVSLREKVEKQPQTFSFTTGPKTAMIHLIFFRDGKHDRNMVAIDNISIKQI
jgi:hypothetical protein